MAKLRYVSDTDPGITRLKQGGGFVYFYPNGRRVTGAATLTRITALAIPPAWSEVWICSAADGHLQATGRDARRRKQYRYHPAWSRARSQVKFDRLCRFGKALPRIRARVRKDLKRPGLPQEKVLAVVVRLLEATCARVGSHEYVRHNRSFGISTLRDRHLKFSGRSAFLSFKGKSGVRHWIAVDDERLAKIVRKCQELPGQQLFQYLDEHNAVRGITSTDVNRYLRAASGQDFTAKDIRTWKGTVLAAEMLLNAPEDAYTGGKKSFELEIVRSVAASLRNRAPTCRKYYIHPTIFAHLHSGKRPILRRVPIAGLTRSELFVLQLLMNISPGRAPSLPSRKTRPRLVVHEA